MINVQLPKRLAYACGLFLFQVPTEFNLSSSQGASVTLGAECLTTRALLVASTIVSCVWESSVQFPECFSMESSSQ